MRWEEYPTTDYRPLRVPTPGIVAWWCSGEVCTDPPTPILCAVVEATNAEHAKNVVAANWSPIGFSVVDEKPADWMPPSDRFPSKGTAGT